MRRTSQARAGWTISASVFVRASRASISSTVSLSPLLSAKYPALRQWNALSFLTSQCCSRTSSAARSQIDCNKSLLLRSTARMRIIACVSSSNVCQSQSAPLSVVRTSRASSRSPPRGRCPCIRPRPYPWPGSSTSERFPRRPSAIQQQNYPVENHLTSPKI